MVVKDLKAIEGDGRKKGKLGITGEAKNKQYRVLITYS